MKVKILSMTFESTNSSNENTDWIRGFFAAKFNEYILLHHHFFDKLVYRYPLVQYKLIDGRPFVIGINEGVDVLKEIFDKYDTITLNNTNYEIIEKSMFIKNQEFGLTNGIYFYEFITPWIALNQKNYETYLFNESNEIRAKLLRNVLTGNIISMSKALGYTVPDKIRCDIDLMSRELKFKKRNFISFSGGFMVNFYIPDYLGIGKSVSKGYGTVRKIETPSNQNQIYHRN